MATQFKQMFNAIALLLAVILTGCDAGSLPAQESEIQSDDPAPLFMTAFVADGSAQGLNLQQKASEAQSVLPRAPLHSSSVSIHYDALHADHRDVDFVVKDGKKHYIDWCIGTQITLELFGRQRIVAESESIREYEGSWGWEGKIVQGGTGRVNIHVYDDSKSIDGQIRLTSENRKLYIVPTGADNVHVLYEFDRFSRLPIESDPVARLAGTRMEQLESLRTMLEEKLSELNVSEEARSGMQYLLDKTLKSIDEENQKIRLESAPEQDTSENKLNEPTTENRAESVAIPSTVRVLVLNGTSVAGPQNHFNLIVSELDELFNQNSDTDVSFEYAVSSPIPILIAGETSLSNDVILAGVTQGLYSTIVGVSTTELRDIYSADLVVTIYNNGTSPGECGKAWLGELPSDDTTGFSVAGTVCTSMTAVHRAHEVGHNFGAGHEGGPGLFVDSRAFVEPGIYMTIMTSGLFQLTSLSYFSQPDPPPPGVLVPIGDSGHDNLLAVNSLASTVAAYRTPTPNPPGKPSFLNISPEYCRGLNSAFWPSVSGADFYELRRSTGIGGLKFLVYSGPFTSIKFSVTSTQYMWVRACNGQGCSGYRQGNRTALYWSGCY